MGGAQVGYNYQDGSLVYGVELDIGYLSAKATDTSSQTTGTGTSAVTSTSTSEAKLGLTTSLRGRVGYAAEDTLIYVTLGAAAAQAKASYLSTTGTTVDQDISVSKTMFGWTVGAGIEYAMFSKMTVKLEYLYHDFGKTTVLDNDVKLTASLGRVGVNYRF
jgi:outer membrane immunogenic protein